MLQFYFLSVLLNAITGFVFLLDYETDIDNASSARFPSWFKDETIRLVLGILTCVTGFFKLLTTVRGDVAVVGDLVPALAGLAGGFTLLYDFYKTRSTVEEELLHPVIKSIVQSKRIVGVVCIGSAILHFLFPTVLFL